MAWEWKVELGIGMWMENSVEAHPYNYPVLEDRDDIKGVVGVECWNCWGK